MLAALADTGTALPSACLVWIYRAPSEVARSEPTDSGRALGDVLDEWFLRNLAALNLRRRDGIKLVFVHAGRARGVDFQALILAAGEPPRTLPEPSCGFAGDGDAIVRQMFASVGPRFCEVFDSLEAAALLPGHDAATDHAPATESQLVKLLEELRKAADVPTLQRQREELASNLADARARLEDTAAKLNLADDTIAAAEKQAANAGLQRSRRDQEFEVLQVQLHQIQEELESYHRNLASAERKRKATQAQLADSQQQCAALRQQLEQMDAALQEQLSHPRIEALSTRQMASTVFRRTISKLVPAPVRNYRARRRALQQAQQALVPLRQSKWFDGAWYLSQYPDVRAAGIDPAEHYHAFGWKEGRDPGPGFSTRYYLDSNQDVKRSGLDPLLHFIEYGMNEGRRPRA